MAGPLFFVDRSLGSVRLPRLLREDGWSLVTMAEHYGERLGQGVADTDWLHLAGENGWPVLAKDEKIRYRRAETDALLRHGVRAFILTSGNLTSAEMAGAFVVHRDAIWRRCLEGGAGLVAVTRTSLREIDLSG